MNEDKINEQTAIEPEDRKFIPSAFHTIVYGGLTVGVLDALAASLNTYVRSGATPDVVWHYVASGVIGRDAASSGGTATVVLGLFFHFCVAFGVATGYYVLSRLIPVMLTFPFISGPLYGVSVYFFMGWVVVPLTAAPKLPFAVSGLVTGIITHIVCVGSPPAFIARRFAKAA
ncbi:hypothetical protein BH10ACI2_BH10ACI2_02300 [soil metagenome]